jgi:NAD(P)-dependent dehydrogenase (short-subunit alcohol dehydrogenase family)
MPKTIVVTGASSDVGRTTALALAEAGYSVYAAIQDIRGRNGAVSGGLSAIAAASGMDLRAIEIDVLSQSSVEAAIGTVISDTGRIDALVHNSSYRISGPANAFTAEQLAQLYEMNVLSTQWVNRAVLPQMRSQGEGLVVWVSSISSAGTTPPYLVPYFAMAHMDSVAGLYAEELGKWGIDCCTVLPRVFGKSVARAPDEESTASVARVIAGIVDLPHGQRPSRVYVHSAQASTKSLHPALEGRRHRLRVAEEAGSASNPVISLAAFERSIRSA